MPSPCTNCDHALPENARFCPHCGQSTKSFKRPFLTSAVEAVHELLDIDGRLAVTLKTLFLKPGVASYEFEQGKRAKYTPPLRLYLVASVVFFLVFSSFQFVYSTEMATSTTTTEHYSRAMFVLFPLFALFIKGFYWQSYYLSNLVFSMHIHTIGFIVLLLIGPLEALEKHNSVFMHLQIIPTLYLGWYLLVAFKTMYRASWWITIAKSLGVFLLYMTSFGIVFDVVLT